MRLALLLLVALAGCFGPLRPPPTLPLRADDPPHPGWPDGVDRADHLFRGVGGAELYGQSWRPRGDIRAVVVIMHGLKDHSDRYAGFAGRLALDGYAVHAFDLRGHGRSAGPRVTVDRFADYVDDLAIFVAEVRRLEPGRPIFVFGHSMGGAIVALYAIDHQPAIAGVVLSGPALALPVSPLTIAITRALAGDEPALRLPTDGFSSSLAVIEAMNADPLIYPRGGPGHTGAELFDGIHQIWTRIDRLTAPLLIVHGTADKLTSPSGSRELVARAPSTDRTLKLYPGLYHDLLHEPDGAQVADDIVAWLDARVGGESLDVIELPAEPGYRHGFTGTVQVGLGALHHSGGGRELDAMTVLTAHLTFGTPGWLGGFRFHSERDRNRLSLYLLGGFVPVRGSGLIGLTAGVGTVEGMGFVLPAELTIELPLGAVRALGRVEMAWDPDVEDPELPVVDLATTVFAGLRLGRDRRYWRHVHAGHGLYAGVTYREQGDDRAWGVEVGGHLSGSR